VNALLCKFTMGQAMNNWNRYWEVVLHNDGGNTIDTRAKDRFDKYMKRIKEAVTRAEMQEEGWKEQEGSRGRSSSRTNHRTMNEL
jgi:hypothetical protein